MRRANTRSVTRSVGCLLIASTLTLTLGACSTPPRKRAPEPEVLAAPAGVRFEMRYFYGQDGTRLFRQAWIPDGQTKGVLVVVHGLKDHGGRYAELGQHVAQQGFAMYTADLRGHGFSGGARQMVENFNDYMVDLALLVRQARTQFPGTPVFLLGHDMGGVIATRFVEMLPTSVQGLALSGATLTVATPKYKLFGLKALAAISPSTPAMPIDLKTFSRDSDVVDDLISDPLVTQSSIPAKTAVQEVSEIQTLQEQTEQLNLPLLVMHGVSDTASPLYGSIALYDAAPSQKKTLKQYPDLGHDLWHEPEKDTVIADLTEWMNGLIKR